MKSRFTSIWGDKAPKRPVSRPAAANAAADSESGDEGNDSTRQSLRALKVMLDRGLMTQGEYEQRKAAILGEKSG